MALDKIPIYPMFYLFKGGCRCTYRCTCRCACMCIGTRRQRVHIHVHKKCMYACVNSRHLGACQHFDGTISLALQGRAKEACREQFPGFMKHVDYSRLVPYFLGCV